MKKYIAIICALTMSCAIFASCGKKDDEKKTDAPTTTAATTEAVTTEAVTTTALTTATATEATTEEAEEENYNTGDASLDNPRNADEIGEKEILVVSFGTSFNDSRRLTIGAIEESIEKAYPDYSVRRAFTPTHLMYGFEYDEIEKKIANYSDKFDKVTIGATLLGEDENFEKVAQILVDEMSKYDDGETAICFMGHGTEHESNAVYTKMQETFKNLGYENYYVGTVEATPSFQDVIDTVKATGKYKKVVLRPLMVVAGDHANNDMAGEEEDSWKSLFVKEGFEVETVISGLGEIPAIQDIYVGAVQDSIEK